VTLLNNTLTFGDVLLGNIAFFDFCPSNNKIVSNALYAYSNGTGMF